MARRAVLLWTGLACGCAHNAPHKPGDEWLQSIKLEGNKQIKSSDLETGLALRRVQRRGGSPDPYLVQIDADRIRGEYLRRGYLDIDVRSRVERKGDAATVIYTLEEGPRAKTVVSISGLPQDVKPADVRDKLGLQDGKYFDYNTYDQAKPMLLGVIQDAGYAHAKLDASVVADRANDTATVDLFYTPGPKCKFGNVEISGAKGEMVDAVRNRLAFSPGQVYSTQAISQTQRNLYGFGRFSTVRVQPDEGNTDEVGIKVSVAESARHQIQLGGGFGIDPEAYEVRGRAGYSIAGWPFPLDTASIDLRPAYAYLRDGSGYEPRIRALAKLERADLFWTYAKGEIAAGYNYLAFEAYTMTGPLGRVGFETPLGTQRVKLRVGWQIEQNWFPKLSDVMKAPSNAGLVHDLGLDHSERIAGYQQALIVDLRNNPIETTLGAYGELHTTEGTRYAGSASDYTEVIGDVRGYLPLLFGSVLAGRARYGAITGQVPVTERFFGGGAVSQRGFGERQLSPFASSTTTSSDGTMSTSTVPYGGAAIVETSIEARVPVTTIKSMPLGFVTFLDGGDVTETPSDIDPSHLHWAVGAGLRLMTIVGPVRFDLGYRLNRTEMGEPAAGSHFAYHLTIGEAF